MRIYFLILALLFSAVFASATSWTRSNGPWGGVITSFVFHPEDPSIIFATGGNWENSSGLYRSTDGGLTWAAVISSGNHLQGVVRFNPVDPNRLLLIGVGVSVSTDSGATWTQISSSFGGSNDFEFHPTNPSIIYAINGGGDGAAQLIFKSDDGGTTWRRIASLGPTQLPGGEIEIDPRNPQTIFAQIGSGLVFKSSNAGQSWVQRSNGLRVSGRGVHGLKLSPSTPPVLYSAGYEGIYKSTNGGNTWIDTGCNCHARQIAIDQTNPEILYAVGRGDDSSALQSVKSLDAGRTWEKLNLPLYEEMPYLAIAVSPIRPSLILAASNERGIYRSENGGQSWLLRTKKISDLGIIALEADAIPRGRLFAIATFGSPLVFQSDNYGRAWRSIAALDSYKVSSVDVHPKYPNVIAAAGLDMAISNDSGKTWIDRSLPHQAGNRWYSEKIHFDSQDTQTLFSFSLNGLAKTKDQGATWTIITPPIKSPYEYSLSFGMSSTPGTLYLGTACSADNDCSGGARVFKSKNSGTTWENITSKGLPFTGAFFDIQVHPKNSAIVYVVGAGLYKSVNAGQTWQLLTAFPADAIKVVLDPQNPSRLFGIGRNAKTIYSSQDGGISWTNFDMTGLNGANTLIVSPWNPTVLFSGAHGVFTYNGAN